MKGKRTGSRVTECSRKPAALSPLLPDSGAKDMSLIDDLKRALRLSATQNASKKNNSSRMSKRNLKRSRQRTPQCPETMEPRVLMAADFANVTNAIADGDWNSPGTWDNGVPNENVQAIVSHGITVELDGTDHEAASVVVHGDLIVPEDVMASTDPTVVKDGRMKLYVNGGLVGDAPASQLWSHVDPPSVGGVGHYTKTHKGYQRNAFFHGQIDKVTTHNRALKESEITTLAAGTTATHDGIPQEDLASLWMFNHSGSRITRDTAPFDSVSDNGWLMGNATQRGGALELDGNGDRVMLRSSRDLSMGKFQEKNHLSLV